MKNNPGATSPFGIAETVAVQNDVLSFDLASAQRTIRNMELTLKNRDDQITKLEGQLKQMQAVLDSFGLANEG